MGATESAVQEREPGVPRAPTWPLDAVIPGTHACCTFGTDEQQTRLVGRFGRTAIRGSHRLLYLAERTSHRTIVAYLKAAGINTDRHLASGQLVIRRSDPAGGPFHADARIDALGRELDLALADGFEGLAAIGEMSWALGRSREIAEIVRYEREVSRVFASAGLMGLCQYDRRVFPPDLLARLCGVHEARIDLEPRTCAGTYLDFTIAEGAPESGAGAPGLKLSGDIDALSAHYLEACLTGYGIRLHGDLALDMSAVNFIDGAASRALVRVAANLSGSRRLRLQGAPEQVVRLFSLCGWAGHPKLLFSPVLQPESRSGARS